MKEQKHTAGRTDERRRIEEGWEDKEEGNNRKLLST